ncbi:hypothetical protein [Paenibacillus sp. HB172176]|uniref:hypothetical protein n=1 Tax=Paenibacillus sp. HB172176 TaxID=2493690 RepID=UPI00143B4A0A|nr:hypothetical protein [Paenibacillus sp. HB172176]
MKKRTLYFAGGFVLFVGLIIGLGIFMIHNMFGNMLRPFTVTIHNKSSFDIVSIESGIVDGNSTDISQAKIASGGKKKLRPDLTLTGEGAVYMKVTDERSVERKISVCGYTEYLSGSAYVVIEDSGTKVEQDCY